MLIYDIHSHLGKTSSGDENSPEDLVNDLKAYGKMCIRDRLPQIQRLL